MDDKANKILVELLQKASDGIDSAVAFSQAQIPDVVHQLLVWNIVSSILAQFFGVAAIILAIQTRRFALKAKANGESWVASDGRPNDRWFISSFSYDSLLVAIPALLIVSGVLAFFMNFDWLKIWLAPKLYLLEYAASLIK